jgi:hypothetical protein
MVDQKVIDERAEQIVRETGTSLERAYELANMQLDPEYSDCGPGMPNDQVRPFLEALMARQRAKKAATKAMAAD